MVGPIAAQYISKGFDWGYYSYCLPYVWDGKLKKLLVTKSKLHLCGWVFNVVVICTYATSFVIRTIRIQVDPEGIYPIWVRAIMMNWTLCWMVSASFTISTVVAKTELPQFLEAYLAYFKAIKEEYAEDDVDVKRGTKRSQKLTSRFDSDICGMLIANNYYTANCVIVCIMGICVYYPFLPIYPLVLEQQSMHLNNARFSQGLSDMNIWNVPAFCFNLISMLYLLGTWYANNNIWLFTSLCYAFDMVDILSELRPGCCKKRNIYKQMHRRQNPESFAKHFLQLQVLHGYFVRVYCRLFIPAFNWLFVSLCAFCIFGCIRYSGIISMMYGNAVMGLAFSTMLPVWIFGKVFEGSSSLIGYYSNWGIHSGSRTHGGLYWKKYMRCLRPLKVRVGSFYFIDKGTTLSVAHSIVDLTVNMLVATQ